MTKPAPEPSPHESPYPVPAIDLGLPDPGNPAAAAYALLSFLAAASTGLIWILVH